MTSPAPCVRCGYCCKKSNCGFASYDPKAKQCSALELLEGDIYTCSIYEEIIKDPSSECAPAFGAGCCMAMFNKDRERILRRKMMKFGKTGEFPEGKISEDDEGELVLGVAADKEKNLVIINFGTPVKWLGLPVKQAMALAESIIKNANDLT